MVHDNAQPGGTSPRPSLKRTLWACVIAYMVALGCPVLGLLGVAYGLVGVYGLFVTPFAGAVGIAPAGLCVGALLLLCRNRGNTAAPPMLFAVGAGANFAGFGLALLINDVPPGFGEPVGTIVVIVDIVLLILAGVCGGVAARVFWAILRGRLIWFARLSFVPLAAVSLWLGWMQILQLDLVRCSNRQPWSEGVVDYGGMEFRFKAPVCALDTNGRLQVYFPEFGIDDTVIEFVSEAEFERAEARYAAPSDKFGPKKNVESWIELEPPAKFRMVRYLEPLRTSRASGRRSGVGILAWVTRSGDDGDLYYSGTVYVALGNGVFFRISERVSDPDLVSSTRILMGDALKIGELVRDAQLDGGGS